jgi:GxxExxY protein
VTLDKYNSPIDDQVLNADRADLADKTDKDRIFELFLDDIFISMIEEELTGQIIKIFYKVYNTLGHGFLEQIYHNALTIELAAAGLKVETQKPIAVYYEGKIVGKFSADLVVEDKVILELKAKERIHEAHEAQLVNYLRATLIEIGLLLNFGSAPEFKRKFYSNQNKKLETSKSGSLIDALFD